jgi:hypothetical protein
MGIHFLCFAHNECTWIQDAVCDTFAIIVRDADFRVGQEQHVLPSNMFNSSCWQVDIVFIKDDIGTLVGIVIVNLTWADLLLRSCVTPKFAAFDAVQVKKQTYHNQHPIDQFLPLTIEVFECLHK